MIFGWERGSSGTGPERYTLRLPLTVSPQSKVPCISNIEMGPYRCTIRKEKFVHAVEVSGFSTGSNARKYAKRFCGAWAWFDLKHHVGVRNSSAISDVELYDKPQPVSDESNLAPVIKKVGWDAVDGGYNHDVSVVVPEHKRLIRWIMGRARMTISPTDSRTVATLLEALGFPTIERVLEDDNLRLALELFSGSFFERSDNAQFLLLITTLESLARITTHGKAQPLRDFVVAELRSDPETSDAIDVGIEVAASYKLRNKLLHEGVAVAAEVREAKTRLTDIVARVLRVRFRRAAGG